MSHAGERGEKQSCPKTERKTSLLDKQIFSPSNASMKNTMTTEQIAKEYMRLKRVFAKGRYDYDLITLNKFSEIKWSIINEDNR